MAENENETPQAEQPQAAAQQAQTPARQNVQVEDGNVSALYANFCRVTGSPEELIIDFGLNPQPHMVPKDPIHVSQRVIVNFYTAKRLLAALQLSIARHEQIFGVLETDVQKRLKSQPGAQQQQAAQQAAAQQPGGK